MKKIITVLLAVMMCLTMAAGLTACGSNDQKTLYVYTNSGFAPYEYLNKSGKVVGVDIDIMNAIGEKLGYKVIVNDTEFNQILVEVGKNEMAVGAAGMTKKPERDDVALASKSYATSIQAVIVQKGTFTDADLVDGKLPLAKLADLTKKKIGVQAGTTGQALIEDACAENGILTGAESFDYTNAIVASDDIGTTLDAVVIDKAPANAICKSNSNLEYFVLNEEPESYVLYFNKKATELIEKVNKILDELIESGKIDEFTTNHSSN